MLFPVDVRFVRKAEEELGTQLPAAYVAHITKTNGGMSPDERWILHPIFDATDRKRITRTANHVVSETKRARGLTFFPASGVVIGESHEGHLLILLPDPESPERLGDAVYWWYPNGGDITLLASSIVAMDGDY